MSWPDQRDMEQPWPPPGPWNFPRAGGEAEEESDLDVSPSSSHYPPVPDGGAQVRAACVVQGSRWGAACGKCPRTWRGKGGGCLMPSHSLVSSFARAEVATRAFPSSGSTHTGPFTSTDCPSPLQGSSPDCRVSAEIRGQLRLCKVDPLSSCACFHASLYYRLQLLCAQLIGTVTDCTSIIVHRVLT